MLRYDYTHSVVSCRYTWFTAFDISYDISLCVRLCIKQHLAIFCKDKQA